MIRYITTIPEPYWPTDDRPWRVTWGFGAFEDFATECEAVAHAQHLRNSLNGDWAESVNDPFDAVAAWSDKVAAMQEP